MRAQARIFQGGMGFAAVVAFAVWAFQILPPELSGQDYVQIARKASEGRAIPPAELSAARAAFDRALPDMGCRADLLRAGATIEIADPALLADNPAIERAERLFRQSLACAPLQGNLWLVLARLQAQRGGPPAETLRLLEKSHDLAPREEWIAVRRLAFEANLDLDLPQASEGRLNEMIHDMVRGVSWRQLVDIYNSSGVRGRQRILRAVEAATMMQQQRFYFHVLWRR